MNLADRQHLVDLFHAAFEQAHSNGLLQPVDLMYFGKYLRVAEPGFSHQSYGHEKLLYLLREFQDLLYIKMDAEVSPPRFYVAVRKTPAPVRAPQRPAAPQPSAKLLEPQWVSGGLVERYLDQLAQAMVQIHGRLDVHERQLTAIQREQEQSRANEARLNMKDQEHEHQVAAIQREMEQGRANEVRMNDELKSMRSPRPKAPREKLDSA